MKTKEDKMPSDEGTVMGGKAGASARRCELTRRSKTGRTVCGLRLVSRFLFCSPAVYTASTVVTFAPLWHGDSPVRGFVASGTMSLDGLFLPIFRQFAFVDQEGPKLGTAFTLENVSWHSIPSCANPSRRQGWGVVPSRELVVRGRDRSGHALSSLLDSSAIGMCRGCVFSGRLISTGCW